VLPDARVRAALRKGGYASCWALKRDLERVAASGAASDGAASGGSGGGDGGDGGAAAVAVARALLAAYSFPVVSVALRFVGGPGAATPDAAHVRATVTAVLNANDLFGIASDVPVAAGSGRAAPSRGRAAARALRRSWAGRLWARARRAARRRLRRGGGLLSRGRGGALVRRYVAFLGRGQSVNGAGGGGGGGGGSDATATRV